MCMWLWIYDLCAIDSNIRMNKMNAELGKSLWNNLLNKKRTELKAQFYIYSVLTSHLHMDFFPTCFFFQPFLNVGFTAQEGELAL